MIDMETKDYVYVGRENYGEDLNVYNVGMTNYKNTVAKPFYKWRANPRYAFHYVNSGKGLFFINDTKYEMHAGQFFFVPKDVPVKYYGDTADPWTYTWITLEGNIVGDIFRSVGLTEQTPVLDVFENPTILKRIIEFQEITRQQNANYFDVVSAFYNVISALSSGAYNMDRKQGLVSLLKKEMIKRYSEADLSFEKMCTQLYISYSYARRLFKAVENDTMANYLKHIRLEQAKMLLKCTSYSTKEIAERCGFSNYNYFLRQFKSYYGVTPKELKRKGENWNDGKNKA